jgi:hypothetical protein
VLLGDVVAYNSSTSSSTSGNSSSNKTTPSHTAPDKTLHHLNQ